MKILVTGGSGFIGSNFIVYMLNKYPEYQIVNLDLLTYAANNKNLLDIQENERYEFVKGNICDRKLIEQLFIEHKFQGVFHFAAESHVDNSIKNPEKFVETNILGTQILLDVARKTWLDENFKYLKVYKNARFHHISTDEVYGSLGDDGYFNERTPYAPNSPYSASKASSDMIVRSYFHTYGMNVVTTNCSNNFGPRQHSEKLIPTIITKALALQKIPIYGDGKNVRDWLFVEDHCVAIDLVFHKGMDGESYLIGGNNEHSNLELVYTVCEILDERLNAFLKLKGLKSFKHLIQFVEDRAGHDYRYAIDATKMRQSFGWQPNNNFKEQLSQTIDWYINLLGM